MIIKLLLLLPLLLSCDAFVYGMEADDLSQRENIQHASPTLAELRERISAASQQASKRLGYDLAMEVFTNDYVNFKDTSRMDHAAIYCYGAGQCKSDYIPRLLELRMPTILFKFSDDVGKGLWNKLNSVKKINLGQRNDILTVLCAVKGCVDAGVTHVHLMGYSRGGAAAMGMIGVTNNFEDTDIDLFQKANVNFEQSKKILACISSVILHCPVVNTTATVKRAMQFLKDEARTKITPQFVQRNEDVFSFYWNHTWPFSMWPAKKDSKCGDTMNQTILPAVSCYDPEEEQPIEHVKKWPQDSFYVWLVVQAKDQITPLEKSMPLIDMIGKTNQKSFYYLIGTSVLGHADYWNEEKNGGLDAFFALQRAPHDQTKLEAGYKIIEQRPFAVFPEDSEEEEEI